MEILLHVIPQRVSEKPEKSFIFLDCTLRHDFLISETKEPPKLLSSSGMRGGKNIPTNIFAAQKHASSKNRLISNFRVMAVRDINVI